MKCTHLFEICFFVVDCWAASWIWIRVYSDFFVRPTEALQASYAYL